MPDVTYPSPAVSAYGRGATRSFPAAGTWLLGGAVAAGLGLGTCAVLVILLWITSPYSDSGPGDALRVAADVWLLAHGTQLVRESTLSGQAAPMGLTPLLLMVLPAWLLYRGTQSVLNGERNEPGSQRPLVAVGWCACGYLLVGGVVIPFAASGPVRVEVLSAALQLPLFVLAVSAVAAWTGSGCPALRLPGPLRTAGTKKLRRVLNWPRLRGVARAVGTHLVALCGGGALLLTGALGWHLPTVGEAFPQLTNAWTGYAAVLLLAVLLVPNAAVWGAGYALGPGFTLGAGSVAGPLGATNHPQLPQFPLLAALPQQSGGGQPGWAGPLLFGLVAVVPLAAGALCGWQLGREAVPVRGLRQGARTWRGTLLNSGLAAVGCGLAMGTLAAYAGGGLGSGALSRFGPGALVTGAAAAVWTAVPAGAVALLMRALRLRRSRTAAGPGTPREAGGRWRPTPRRFRGRRPVQPADSEAPAGVAAPAAQRSAGH